MKQGIRRLIQAVRPFASLCPRNSKETTPEIPKGVKLDGQRVGSLCISFAFGVGVGFGADSIATGAHWSSGVDPTDGRDDNQQ